MSVYGLRDSDASTTQASLRRPCAAEVAGDVDVGPGHRRTASRTRPASEKYLPRGELEQGRSGIHRRTWRVSLQPLSVYVVPVARERRSIHRWHRRQAGAARRCRRTIRRRVADSPPRSGVRRRAGASSALDPQGGIERERRDAGRVEVRDRLIRALFRRLSGLVGVNRKSQLVRIDESTEIPSSIRRHSRMPRRRRNTLPACVLTSRDRHGPRRRSRMCLRRNTGLRFRRSSSSTRIHSSTTLGSAPSKLPSRSRMEEPPLSSIRK